MGKFTESRRVLAAAAMTLLIMCPSAIGADRSRKVTVAATNDATSNATAGTTMSLDDIQDVAFTLRRIHQEAIDIFVESTRKKVAHLDPSLLTLTSIPKTSFEDQSSYLPMRKGWLAFFIGTIESLVSMLNEELNHLDEVAQRNGIPSAEMPEWRSMVTEWTDAVHGLNQQLDVCAKVLDDPSPDNVEVAKSAQAIDNQVAVLHAILLRADKLTEGVSLSK